MTQPSIEVVQLTPDLAREFLSHNTKNYRGVRDPEVHSLAGVMRRGEWVINNDAICFSEDGTMINGQHRCLAVIRSGVTVPILVMRGVAMVAADSMDTGRKRTPGQVLAHHGYSNATELAGAIRSYNNLIHGYNAGNLTNPQILNFADKHHEVLRISMSHGKKVARDIVGTPKGMCAGIHFAFGQIDPERANEFFVRFSDGTGLYDRHPIHTLRKKLRTVTGGPSRRHRLDEIWFSAVVIKSWNIWYEHGTVRNLDWRGRANPAEAFPSLPYFDLLVRP